MGRVTGALTAAQQAVVAAYIPMAARRARRWADRAGIPREDAIGAAMVGLCVGVRDHDPSRMALTPWLQLAVDGEVRHELRRWGKWRTRCPAALDSEPPAPPDDAARAVEVAELAAAVRSCFGALTPRERTALELHMGGLRWCDVARAMGIAPSSVRRLVRDAGAKLRRRGPAGLDG